MAETKNMTEALIEKRAAERKAEAERKAAEAAGRGNGSGRNSGAYEGNGGNDGSGNGHNNGGRNDANGASGNGHSGVENGRIKKTERRSALGFWLAAAVWLVGAFFFPLYKLGHVIVIGIISVIVCLVGNLMGPRKIEEEVVLFESGDAELDSMINEIDHNKWKIVAERRKMEKFEDAQEICQLVCGIESTIDKIRDVCIEKKKNIASVHRFMNYYLPTTVKLVDKYEDFISQESDTKNITEAANEAREALIEIDKGLKRQLDALFADDVLDVSTDRVVLETMLKKDNLLG